MKLIHDEPDLDYQVPRGSDGAYARIRGASEHGRADAAGLPNLETGVCVCPVDRSGCSRASESNG